jgi:hypothetical protein
MMDLLLKIPENVGWMIDGALIVVLAYALAKVIKLAVQAWREWHEDDDEEIFEES